MADQFQNFPMIFLLISKKTLMARQGRDSGHTFWQLCEEDPGSHSGWHDAEGQLIPKPDGRTNADNYRKAVGTI